MSAPVQLVPQTAPPSGAPNMSFAAPSGPGRTNWGPTPYAPAWSGFAQPINQRPGGTPDPMRTMQMPQQEDYPDPGPPENFYYGAHGRPVDRLRRGRAESETAAPLSATGHAVNAYGPNPSWTPQPEYRTTQKLSPSTWSFMRPFDQRFRRRFDGSHFSMADHRRNYPVYGMEPAQPWRSTVITQPPPWGQNLTVNTPSNSYQPNPIISSPDIGMPDRGWVMR